MMKHILFLTVLLSLFSSVSAWSEGTAPVVTLTEAGKYELSLYLDVLEDSSNTLTIQDVMAPSHRDSFVSYEGVHPNLGVLNHPVWIHFTISNPGDDRELYVSYNYSVTDSVDYFEVLPAGNLRHLTGTEGGNSEDTAFSYRRIVFDTFLPSGSTREYYCKIYSPRSAATIIMTLWDLKSFIQYERFFLFFYGLVFGAVAYFSTYFFRMSHKLKEPAQFWFSMYLITFGILALIRGGVFQSLFNFLPVPWYNLIDVASIGGASFSGIKLLTIVLEVKNRSRTISLFLSVMQWSALVFIPLAYGPLVLSGLLGFMLFGITPVFTTVLAFIYWKKGVENAEYFALGWLATNTTCLIEFFRIMGIIPWYPWMYGALNTALIWSLAFYTYTIGKSISSYKYFSQLDSLTGLSNRYTLEQFLNAEWNRNMRAGRPLSVLMIDVDRFKAYNDSNGHQKGDDCLIRIAEILKNHSSRAGDLAGRYGGEEFIVILSETDSDGAVKVAEKIRNNVIDLDIRRDDVYGPVVTLSAGIATEVPTKDKSPSWLIEQADRGLYYAKNTGRNKVSTPPLTTPPPPKN